MWLRIGLVATTRGLKIRGCLNWNCVKTACVTQWGRRAPARDDTSPLLTCRRVLNLRQPGSHNLVSVRSEDSHD